MERQSFISGFLRAASQRQDLVIVVLLITAISAMILPISPLISDILIAVNISISVLFLMVAFSVKSPVDFSSLPAIILISTVFRLSISIAATRLILIEGDGGQIIQTFGDFVISGNVLVGLVIFLIITVVQFVVITKGSERVAEVAARFSLDGLPGKQMSIDSDLRNGDIDQTEARRRRQQLERESQLYGAMDGAMKFVKGDAIAGIIIILVNLLGGIAVGMLQRGLTFGESTHLFSLLTIGEGLIAQIPALFISLTAGTIVTRVATGTNQNLGADIVSQIASRPEALRLAALVLLGLALVPGFPTAVFLGLAVFFGVTGTLLLRSEAKISAPVSAAASRAVSAEVSMLLPAPAGTRVTVVVSQALHEHIQTEGITMRLRSISDSIAHDAGFATPSIGYRIHNDWRDFRYMIELDMVPEVIREINLDRLYVRASMLPALEKSDIKFTLVNPKSAFPVASIDPSYRAALEAASISALAGPKLIENDVTNVLRRNASHFLGLQETRRLLTSMESDYKDLLREVQRVAPIQKIADVLRRLLDEGVSIRNMRLILETVLEHAPREQDTDDLVNQVRTTLRRQICYQHADDEKVITGFVVERQLEDTLKAALQKDGRNDPSADPELASFFVNLLRQRASDISENDYNRAVVLVSPGLRRLVWQIVTKSELNFPVLSYADISPEYYLRTLATLGGDFKKSQGRNANEPAVTPQINIREQRPTSH